MKLRLLIFIFLGLITGVQGQFYSGSDQSFGKNRVQYQEFFWQYYRYKYFNVYFYKEGEGLAAYVSKRALEIMPEMESRLDFPLEDKVQFIVYKSYSDFKQSNIGIDANSNNNVGGTTRIVGNKVFVFYEGTHEKLDAQIRSGIAEVILNQLMYGGDITEMVRSSTFLSMPEWYRKGLVSYLSKGWNTEIENSVKDGVLSGRYEYFNRLTGDEAKYAGHSIWYYIARTYGEQVIANILYMTRLSRSIETGFMYVLGMDLDLLSLEHMEFFQEKFKEDESARKDPKQKKIDVKIGRNQNVTHARLSPKADKLAYATNILGQYRIYVKDLKTGKRKKIVKGSHKINRIIDNSHPIICWHPNGKILAYTEYIRGKLYLNLYSLTDGKSNRKEIFAIDNILDMDFSNSGKLMVFSATQNGKTNLYKYYVIGNRHEKLTNDLFDDLNPRFIQNDEAIVFSSNRTNTQLGYNKKDSTYTGNFDIYVYHLKDEGQGSLEQITFTPGYDELDAFEYGSNKYTFLSDQAGVINRFYAKYDSTILRVDTAIHYQYFASQYPLSNLRRNIIDYSVQINSDKYQYLTFRDGEFEFYEGKLTEDSVVSLAELKLLSLKSIKKVDFMGLDSEAMENAKEKIPNSELEKDYSNPYEDNVPETNNAIPAKRKDDGGIDFDNYVFSDEESKKKEKESQDKLRNNILGIKDSTGFVLPQRRNYRLNFAYDVVQTQVDNNFQNNFYQLLSGPNTLNPGLGAFLSLSATDLFEDYKISGGVRFSFSLNNHDYIFSVSNRKKRLDKTLTYQKQGVQISLDNIQGDVFRTTTHSVQYALKWPINEVFSVSGVPTVRVDRGVVLARDFNTLAIPNEYRYQAGVKLESVFDNSLNLGTNLYSGFRAKAFVEFYSDPENSNGQTRVIGLDLRHYQPLHKTIIWANRLSASTTGGGRKVLYMMGGLDRWMILPTTEETPFPDLTEFFYQSAITPMRGFNRNIRNGNSFAMINSEVRVPLFKYLIKRPLKSEFLESFQSVLFADAGTAWVGANPFSDENTFNTKIIRQNPLTIRINKRVNPIVGGYGFGFRGRIWGYYLRADWAWGVLDGKTQPRQFYLSLGLDF
ncbi:hypothetical protein [Luteibaculum oceani]|uniref:Translocation protein TolB n=1 Tax=Luteibaculum oceani TaxID=1294296 RepID=A0A5C6VEZ5_9FLAO|nr:hypothetical protein [Luteibaculum oceani]TXC81788.1 hypothetical protein FRX97_04525 [Luteibaculum oceani]